MVENAAPAIAVEWPEPDIAVLRLVQEAQRNSLNDALVEEMDRALEALAEAPPRALIVTGQGRAFCSGGDIRKFIASTAPPNRDPGGANKRYVAKILGVFRRLRTLPAPTIAAINSHAMGGGLELALNCDFRLAAEGVRLACPEVRLGVLAAGAGVQQLHRIVGRAKALEMLLLGETVDAETAARLGLVTSIHPSGELETAALALARRFRGCAAEAVAETKRAVYRAESCDVDAADEIALDAVRVVAGSPDFREGMSAFLDKRPPAFGPLNANRPNRDGQEE